MPSTFVQSISKIGNSRPICKRIKFQLHIITLRSAESEFQLMLCANIFLEVICMIEICCKCKRDYLRDVLVEFDGELLCPECLREETSVCQKCGRRFWKKGSDTSRGMICKVCQKELFTVCRMCGSPILWKAAYYIAEDSEHNRPICWVCYGRYTK